MKKLILVLGCLGLFYSAQAEVLESDVSIQIKVYYQKDNVVKGNQVSFVGGVATFKTSDVIQAIGNQVGEAFSSKARLIYAINITTQTPQITYIIRDPARQSDYTTLFQFFSFENVLHVVTNRAVTNMKGKANTDNNLSSIKVTSAGVAEFKTANNNVHLRVHGPLIRTQRMVPSKQYPNALLPLLSTTISGIGSYKGEIPGASTQDYAQVAIKINLPKIKPSL